MKLDLYLSLLIVRGIINVLQYINCSKKQNYLDRVSFAH